MRAVTNRVLKALAFPESLWLSGPQAQPSKAQDFMLAWVPRTCHFVIGMWPHFSMPPTLISHPRLFFCLSLFGEHTLTVLLVRLRDFACCLDLGRPPGSQTNNWFSALALSSPLLSEVSGVTSFRVLGGFYKVRQDFHGCEFSFALWLPKVFVLVCSLIVLCIYVFENLCTVALRGFRKRWNHKGVLSAWFSPKILVWYFFELNYLAFWFWKKPPGPKEEVILVPTFITIYSSIGNTLRVAI